MIALSQLLDYVKCGEDTDDEGSQCLVRNPLQGSLFKASSASEKSNVKRNSTKAESNSSKTGESTDDDFDVSISSSSTVGYSSDDYEKTVSTFDHYLLVSSMSNIEAKEDINQMKNAKKSSKNKARGSERIKSERKIGVLEAKIKIEKAKIAEFTKSGMPKNANQCEKRLHYLQNLLAKLA